MILTITSRVHYLSKSDLVNGHLVREISHRCRIVSNKTPDIIPTVLYAANPMSGHSS